MAHLAVFGVGICGNPDFATLMSRRWMPGSCRSQRVLWIEVAMVASPLLSSIVFSLTSESILDGRGTAKFRISLCKFVFRDRGLAVRLVDNETSSQGDDELEE